MARKLGFNTLVDEVLAAIVPRVFSDAGERVSFPETGEPYEAARLRLARAIAGAGR
jgi:riboflavin biosynthesis pyrimidine reductase